MRSIGRIQGRYGRRVQIKVVWSRLPPNVRRIDTIRRVVVVMLAQIVGQRTAAEWQLRI